ncbi:neuralized-like protein 4 isoform X3 [Mytilus galloprovincialis]|uniref:neuralized-like protein 4 isoform X3 n=1 Tax=Mytilus galloprovincialis TaxID=29158 RepID=UPI003F7C77E4
MWKFHRICAANISLENNCTTAKRLNPTKTLSDGICFTNTPLVNDKVYEIQVDELVTYWSETLDLGVTTNIPSDLTEIRWGKSLKESWILGCNSLYKNGEEIGSYSLNLDKLQVGDKLGIMKASDSTLHFYLNGIDHGKAFSNLPEEFATGAGAGAQVAIKKAHTLCGRPADWNVQTVCEFIESIPNCAPYVEKFRSEQVNGAALLELDKKDLKEFFEMPLGLAVNVCSHLKKYEEKNK